MSPNKRKRAVSEGDVQTQHSKKKTVNPREEDAPSNPRPTTMDPKFVQSIADGAMEDIDLLRFSLYPFDKLAIHDNRLGEVESKVAQIANALDELRNSIPLNSIKSVTNERDKLQDRLKATQDKLRAEQDELEAVRSELESTRTRLGEMESKVDSAMKRNDLLAEDIRLIGTARQAAPDLDNALEGQFRELRDNVKWFVLTFCEPKILISSDSANIMAQLAGLSDITPRKFLRSRLHAQLFVEGYIWRILSGCILKHPFNIWGKTEAIGQIVDNILEYTDAPIPTQQLWRGMTGQLLSNRPLRKTPAWSKILFDQIAPLLNTDEESVKSHVEKIVTETTQLAKTLAQSRTTCVFQSTEQGADDATPQRYNQTWMEIIEKSIDHYDTVDFIVSPALVQLTNSAGDTFIAPRVLVKAEVCYGQGPRHGSGHASKEQQQQPTSRRRTGRAVQKSNGGTNEKELDELFDDEVVEVVDDSTGEYRGSDGATMDGDGSKASRRKK